MLTAIDFLNSIGINTHLNYGDTQYGNFQIVEQTLLTLGITHVRDGLHGGPNVNDDAIQAIYQPIVALAKKGITFDMCHSPNDHLEPMSGAMLNLYWNRCAMAIESLEGWNEPDLSGMPNWAAAAKAWQSSLFASAKSMAAGVTMPVIQTALANAAYAEQLGDLTGSIDYGALHAYAGGNPPSAAIPHELGLIRIACGSKPVRVTEAGWHTAVNSHGGVSERAQAIYSLRLFALNFNNAIDRTFLYELLEPQMELSLTDPEQHWGIVRANGTAKPAVPALSNLTRLLNQVGAGTPPPLKYTISGTGYESLLVNGAQGYLLMLWQETSVYELNKRQDLMASPIAVKITFQTAARKVSVYRPTWQETPFQVTMHPAAIAVNVPDDLMCVWIEL